MGHDEEVITPPQMDTTQPIGHHIHIEHVKAHSRMQ
jgi:hypothetical protein